MAMDKKKPFNLDPEAPSIAFHIERSNNLVSAVKLDLLGEKSFVGCIITLLVCGLPAAHYLRAEPSCLRRHARAGWQA